MLYLANGEPFTAGVCNYRFREASEFDISHRIIVSIRVEDIETEGVLDTGAIYLICTPALAEFLQLDLRHALGSVSLKIRGGLITGALHRLSLTLRASDGADCTVEVTAFVPEPNQDAGWDNLPVFLGVQGCLERLRFAVDPSTEKFYFGSISWDDL
jgi:hypothetical protein